jgi:hypothetical protein
MLLPILPGSYELTGSYSGPEVWFEDIVSDLLERRLNAIGTYLK